MITIPKNNADGRPSVLLISVDALKPEFVFEQERLGITLPNITHYFVENEIGRAHV